MASFATAAAYSAVPQNTTDAIQSALILDIKADNAVEDDDLLSIKNAASHEAVLYAKSDKTSFGKEPLNGHRTIVVREKPMTINAKQADAFNPGPEGITVFVVGRLDSMDDPSVSFIRKQRSGSIKYPGWNLAALQRGFYIAFSVRNRDNRRSLSSPIVSDSDWVVLSLTTKPEKSELQASINGYVFPRSGPINGTLKDISNDWHLEVCPGTEFAELLIYKRALTKKEHDIVAAGLLKKYNITATPPATE